MPGGVKIGEGFISIEADMTKIDNAMAALPSKTASKLDKAMKAIKAQMARNQLEMKVAVNTAAVTGNTAPVVKLAQVQDQLKAKMEAVIGVATRQAQALQNAERAAIANSAVPALEKKLEKLGQTGKQAGKEVEKAGMSGAMALMILAQAADDAQYGFRAIVNNVPQIATAFASLMGKDMQTAMKWGGIASIAAVAINQILNHWDQLFDRFGYGTDTMKLVWEQFWGHAKDITVDALDEIEARIKDLQNKPIKTAVDLNDIKTLKDQAKDLQAARQTREQLKNARSPFEKESGEKIAQLLAGTDNATMDRMMTDLITQRAAGMNAVSPAVLKESLTPAEEAKIRAGAPSSANIGGIYGDMDLGPTKADQDAAVEAEKARRRAASSTVKEVNKQKADDEINAMIAKAKSGDTAGQAALVQALVDAGYKGMAAMVESLSPEAAADSAAMVTQQPSDARQKAIRDMLNKQGKTQEQDYFEQEYNKKTAIREMLNKQGRSGEQDYFQHLADQRSREATRFADQLQPRLSMSALMDAPASGKLEEKVKAALQKAGVAADDIGKMTTEVAAKLRQGVQDRIRTKVLGGLTHEQAVRSVREEDKAARRALDRTPKSEIMSTESYLNKLLVAGFDRNSQEAKPVKLEDGQIDGVNERLDKILDATKENKPGVARFSDGGGGDPARENGPTM